MNLGADHFGKVITPTNDHSEFHGVGGLARDEGIQNCKMGAPCLTGALESIPLEECQAHFEEGDTSHLSRSSRETLMDCAAISCIESKSKMPTPFLTANTSSEKDKLLKIPCSNNKHLNSSNGRECQCKCFHKKELQLKAQQSLECSWFLARRKMGMEENPLGALKRSQTTATK